MGEEVLSHRVMKKIPERGAEIYMTEPKGREIYEGYLIIVM